MGGNRQSPIFPLAVSNAMRRLRLTSILRANWPSGVRRCCAIRRGRPTWRLCCVARAVTTASPSAMKPVSMARLLLSFVAPNRSASDMNAPSSRRQPRLLSWLTRYLGVAVSTMFTNPPRRSTGLNRRDASNLSRPSPGSSPRRRADPARRWSARSQQHAQPGRTAMTDQSTICPDHLRRPAFVYIRQSSLAQVENDTESTLELPPRRHQESPAQ